MRNLVGNSGYEPEWLIYILYVHAKSSVPGSYSLKLCECIKLCLPANVRCINPMDPYRYRPLSQCFLSRHQLRRSIRQHGALPLGCNFRASHIYVSEGSASRTFVSPSSTFRPNLAATNQTVAEKPLTYDSSYVSHRPRDRLSFT